MKYELVVVVEQTNKLIEQMIVELNKKKVDLIKLSKDLNNKNRRFHTRIIIDKLERYTYKQETTKAV